MSNINQVDLKQINPFLSIFAVLIVYIFFVVSLYIMAVIIQQSHVD